MAGLTSDGWLLCWAWQSIKGTDLHKLSHYLRDSNDLMSIQYFRILWTSYGIHCFLFLNISFSGPWRDTNSIDFLGLCPLDLRLNEVGRQTWTIRNFSYASILINCYFKMLFNCLYNPLFNMQFIYTLKYYLAIKWGRPVIWNNTDTTGYNYVRWNKPDTDRPVQPDPVPLSNIARLVS